MKPSCVLPCSRRGGGGEGYCKAYFGRGSLDHYLLSSSSLMASNLVDYWPITYTMLPIKHIVHYI